MKLEYFVHDTLKSKYKFGRKMLLLDLYSSNEYVFGSEINLTEKKILM